MAAIARSSSASATMIAAAGFAGAITPAMPPQKKRHAIPSAKSSDLM
jgi:hypothetical protein